MLYIDGFLLSFLKDELNKELSGKKIGKIFQYDNQNISIFFGKTILNISTNPELPIAYLTTGKEESSFTPPNFCLTLRKALINSIVTSVEQFQNDRILLFNFSAIDEIGEKRSYKLIVELMGKHSNLFLTSSDYKIIDLLKRFSIEENSLRILMPGIFYKFPVITKKRGFREIDEKFFKEAVTCDKDIISNIEGIGSYSAKQCFGSFESFKNYINQTASPVIYSSNSELKFASFIPFTEFEKYNKKIFTSCNSLIEAYIESTIKSRSFNTIFKRVHLVVLSELKKLKKLIAVNEKDSSKYSDFNKYKEIGDILAANLYQMKSNSKEITLYDFYNNSEITVTLNPEITAAENMKNYYNKFSKFKRGYNFSIEREVYLKNDLEYFDSVLMFLNSASDIDTLKSIESELQELGYIKAPVEKRKSKKEPLYSILEIEYKNFTLLAGKNNRANEYLTMKVADKNDLWLHAKDIPGSHVIIKGETEPDNEVIEYAASIAAFFSKASSDSKVNVDYTFKKYVKKVPGSKPGFVTYTNQKTVAVTPFNPN